MQRKLRIFVLMSIIVLVFAGCGGGSAGGGFSPATIGSSPDSSGDTIQGLAPGIPGEKGANNLRKIVVFQAGVDDGQKEAALKKHGNFLKHLRAADSSVVELSSETAVESLKKEPGVLRVDNDDILEAQGKAAPPPAQTLPWGIDRIDAELAWTVSTGNAVKVAILDSGIDLYHPDLGGNIKGDVNIITPSKSGNDDNGHGSHVAGIAGAINDAIGVVGGSHQIYLYAVKFLNSRGTGRTSDAIDGIDWCIANGIKVINMSFGNSARNESLEAAIGRAHDAAGIVMIAASGNSGGAVLYPAAYEKVIAVTAVAQGDSFYTSSCTGSQIDFTAPGVNIYSTYKSGAYATKTGTSMAAPHVTACAALILAKYGGSLSPAQVRTKLDSSAVPVAGLTSNQQGKGCINANTLVTTQ
jgi:subtilisin family serine protease